MMNDYPPPTWKEVWKLRDEVEKLTKERDVLAQAVHMLTSDTNKMRAELEALRIKDDPVVK